MLLILKLNESTIILAQSFVSSNPKSSHQEQLGVAHGYDLLAQ